MSNPDFNKLPPNADHTAEVLPPGRELAAFQEVQIDLDNPLAGQEAISERFHIKGDLVASVRAGQKYFYVVDVRWSKSNRDFYVVDGQIDVEEGKGYKGIKKGQTLTFGRDHHQDRFAYPDTTSSDHFEVSSRDEGLYVRNLNPTNPTFIAANLVEAESELVLPPRRMIADRTVLALRGVVGWGEYDEADEETPYGYYHGLPIVGRKSTRVSGGVYLGSSREAIVIDDQSQAVIQAYTDLSAHIQEYIKGGRTLPTDGLLGMVKDTVRRLMPYDANKVSAIVDQYKGNRLVGLSRFIEEHAGVCRHQGAFAAVLTEMLIRDGQLLGTVGLERNKYPDKFDPHGWAVFRTMHRGRPLEIVIDPAQNFVGTKNRARQENRWEYDIPSDDYTTLTD